VSGFLLRRGLWSVGVLVFVGLATFFLTYVMPADPARVIAGPQATAADVAAIRHALGLDEPFLTQLTSYLSGLARGDFGYSYVLRQPVLPVILSRFPATAQLALAGLLLSVLIGVPLGIASAVRHGTRVDHAGQLGSIAMVAAPPFWVGLMLLYLLAFLPRVLWHVEIFPVGGTYVPFDLRGLVLPALTVAIAGAAYYARLTRLLVLDELHRDYVRTARAKGLGEDAVVWRHVLRNAVPVVLAQVGLDLGQLLGGIVVVEVVFGWPGIGRLGVDSLASADIPMILGTVFFGMLMVVAANFAVDFAYAYFDPTTRA